MQTFVATAFETRRHFFGLCSELENEQILVFSRFYRFYYKMKMENLADRSPILKISFLLFCFCFTITIIHVESGEKIKTKIVSHTRTLSGTSLLPLFVPSYGLSLNESQLNSYLFFPEAPGHFVSLHCCTSLSPTGSLV